MTTNQQCEALAALAEVWALSPDVRLGQLFAHLGFMGEAHLGRGLGYIGDEELLRIIHKHRGELLARLESPNQSLEETAAASVSSN